MNITPYVHATRQRLCAGQEIADEVAGGEVAYRCSVCGMHMPAEIGSWILAINDDASVLIMCSDDCREQVEDETFEFERRAELRQAAER